MYREQAWFDAFEFQYDMSVPNAAHLEPQRGGCCTVMPYFVGDILELPLTTTQDYTLFHILNDYSTTLWQEQIRLITGRHGLVSVITHPDYLVGHARTGGVRRAAAAPGRSSRTRRVVDGASGRDQSLVAESSTDDAGVRWRRVAHRGTGQRTRARRVCLAATMIGSSTRSGRPAAGSVPADELDALTSSTTRSPIRAGHELRGAAPCGFGLPLARLARRVAADLWLRASSR